MTDEPVLIVTSADQAPRTSRIWGTGGWLEPEAREALDWLVLCRFAGWGVEVCEPAGLQQRLDAGVHWVILALEAGRLKPALIAWLSEWAERTGGVVVHRLLRDDAHGDALALSAGASARAEASTGTELAYRLGGVLRHRTCAQRVTLGGLAPFAGTDVVATLDGTPVVTRRPLGGGAWMTLGFHPSEVSDADGAFSDLLRSALIEASSRPVVWLDHQGTVVLRMDDPGAGQSVYLRSWAYRQLDEKAWQAIGCILRRYDARLSMCYCAGWVDDGDETRGRLTVGGATIARERGRVHASTQVRYEDVGGHAPGTVHDYASAFAGIQRIRADGLGDCEVHGYTHQDPDTVSWAAATDRYDNVAWFRELGAAASRFVAATGREHPVALGTQALRRTFGVHPTTFVSPGDVWTDDALHVALDCGLLGVSSYYFALRDHGRYCWATHVEAPYLDQASPRWFARGLPVIGYFHDMEPAVHGPEWLERQLAAWTYAGARRFIDFRELHSGIARRFRVRASSGSLLKVDVAGAGAPDVVRQLRLQVAARDDVLPRTVTLRTAGATVSAAVTDEGDGTGSFAFGG